MLHNILLIEDTNPLDIAQKLRPFNAVYATNGIYMPPPEVVIPTTLAGFEYITDLPTTQADSSALVIAVNSNISMQTIKEQKIQNAHSASEKASIFASFKNIEDQKIRALKVAEPVALQHSNYTIVVLFYDEGSCIDLYKTLKESHVKLNTLFKYGYGLSPQGPKIEGSEYFNTTLAFPFVTPNTTPVCADITPTADQRDVVKVVSLHESLPNMLKSPYLSAAGVLFPVHEDLLAYSQTQEIKRQSRQTPYPL